MSLPCIYTSIDDYFKDVIKFLSNYSWLYKDANTQILTKQLLEYFPSEWYPHFEKITNDELNEIPFGFITDEWPKTLKTFIQKLESLKPHNINTNNFEDMNLPVQFFKGLSLKKKHEILNFAPVIHEYCKSFDINIIIDIGAGLGYLPQLLYKMYGYKILAVEADETKVQTARKRQNELYNDSINHIKYLHHFVDETSSEILQKSLIHYNLITENESVCLIGLHACADLSVTLLRIFSKTNRIKQAIVMPCCYHRLKKIEREDYSLARDQFGAETFMNFPVSDSLRDVYHDEKAGNFLTSAFLRLACQNTAASWRCMSPEDHRRHSICAMRRAVLQLIAEKGGYHLSRLKRKSHFNTENDSFISYLDNLKTTHVLTHSEMADHDQLIDSELFREEMLKTWQLHENRCQLLEIYTAFQTSLQSVCENLVLLDRVQMITELGLLCHVQKITDDNLSPRCYALVARKP